MKTSFLPLITLLLFSTTLFSQSTDTKEFGEISLKDFEKKDPEDPEAPAIVLFDIGHTDFVRSSDGNGFDIRFVRTKRILIKKKAGLFYADVNIPYYVDGRNQTERVEDIKANTYYLENGSLRKAVLKKKDIFTEKSSENWRQKKFAFPNAIEGAIIEYTYTLRSPFLFKLPDWEFQSAIPTLHSRYHFNLIPFYEYVYLLQGASKFDDFKVIQDHGLPRHFAGVTFYEVGYVATMNNVPAFKDESFISSVDDYIIKMDFQLAGFNSPDGSKREILTTYPKLIKSLIGHENFGKYLKKATKEAKNILSNSINVKGQDAEEKIKTIINYVKTNYDWNGKSRKYTKLSAKEVVKQKKGNSAEINLLLVALLRQAAIDADPVIFSTRDHGKIHKTYPFDHQFNSVVAFVNLGDIQILTDGTEPIIPYNRIPVRCINDQGLVIKEGKEIWVNMYGDISSKNTRRIIITPNPSEENLTADIHSSMTEIDGYLFRGYYENNFELIEKDLAENGFENIQNIQSENFTHTNKPYKISFQANRPIEVFDDKILIPPFLNYPPEENLLKQKTRTYPIDFIYKKARNYGSKINIPNGYKVSELPSELIIDNALIKIIYKAVQQDNIIKTTGAIIYKKSKYEPKDYTRIKNHIDAIVEKFNEPIVLEME